MDEQEVIDCYSEDIIENMFGYRDKGYLEWDQDGKHFYLDFSYYHTGGLEGFYVDEYSGTLYIDNEGYYIKLTDVFCTETNFTLERDEQTDLIKGDDGFVDLNKQETQTKEGTNMTNTMQVVTVILMDQDDKLKGTNLQIIGKFEDVVIPAGQDEMTTLLKLALNGDVKEMLDKHNSKRCEIINNQTLERTGKKINLQPITIEDVKILIK